MKAEQPVDASRRDGFDDLFIAEYGKVAAIARRVLGDSHAAEDVAQDVFAAFYGRYPRGTVFASGWLHAAAVHAALNALRASRRRQRREIADARAARPLAVADAIARDPQAIVEQSELRTAVSTALARLPTKSAAVLALRYSGLSYAEVADALRVSVGQVGTLLVRAEAALRKEMAR